MLSIANKIIPILFICLITLNIGGCGYYARLKQQEQERQKWEARQQKEKEYLENLQPCSSTEWFDKCNPNFIPNYRSVVVHIKPMVTTVYDGSVIKVDKMHYYEDAKKIIEYSLLRKGYKVLVGRSLESKEYVEDVEACSIVSVLSKRLTEIKHHKPLFMKLSRENNNWSGYDAVLFFEYSHHSGSIWHRGVFDYLPGWRVRFQLFDIAKNKIVMWTNESGFTELREKEFGKTHTEIVGNKIYERTATWYTNSLRDVFKEAVQEAFDYLPRWSGGSLIPQKFDNKLNCRRTNILIWK